MDVAATSKVRVLYGVQSQAFGGEKARAFDDAVRHRVRLIKGPHENG